jgi:hypothetical protein
VIASAAGIGPLLTNGKVHTPKLSLDKYTVEPVAQRSASTFAGYCRRHEESFHSFENALKLDKPQHYMQQMMRSAAREMTELEVKADAYDRLLEFCNDLKGSNGGLPPVPIADAFIDAITEQSVHLGIAHAHMMFVHTDATERVEANATELPDWLVAINHERRYEVAISGSASVLFVGEQFSRVSPLVFVTTPNGDNALTLLGSTKDDSREVMSYMRRALNKDESAEKLISDWMSVTDHWFAKTHWWHERTDVSKSDILGSLQGVRVLSGLPIMRASAD